MKNEQDIHHKFQEEQKAKKNSYRENVIEVNNNLNSINPGNDSKNISLPKIALINLGKEIEINKMRPLLKEKEKLEEKNKILNKENVELKEENRKLKEKLEEKNKILNKENNIKLKEENQKLKELIEKQKEKILKLKKQLDDSKLIINTCNKKIFIFHKSFFIASIYN